jgi:hypothetical protein
MNFRRDILMCTLLISSQFAAADTEKKVTEIKSLFKTSAPSSIITQVTNNTDNNFTISYRYESGKIIPPHNTVFLNNCTITNTASAVLEAVMPETPKPNLPSYKLNDVGSSKIQWQDLRGTRGSGSYQKPKDKKEFMIIINANSSLSFSQS